MLFFLIKGIASMDQETLEDRLEVVRRSHASIKGENPFLLAGG